jgi:hypothetical protein
MNSISIMVNSISIIVGAALIAGALLLSQGRYQVIAMGEERVVRLNTRTGSLTPCIVGRETPGTDRCLFPLYVGD